MYPIVVLLLRSITLAGLFLSAPPFAGATELVRPRPLMEYTDILLAQQLDVAVSALDAHVTQCVGSGGGNAAECSCRYRSEVETAKAVYARTLEARPKWQGKILYWKNTDTQASRQLIMPAIDRQLQSSITECVQAQ